MFWTLAIPSVCLTLLSSYAIRIFEGPAKARHSLYFWDQMWMVSPPTHPPLLLCTLPSARPFLQLSLSFAAMCGGLPPLPLPATLFEWPAAFAGKL